ncbi:MAG: OB-fold domain-containing protein [Elusimicrobia bacterium]|nr:OB-fold domain-containing protein [Elusimicrobiota bacterium]
MPAAITRVKGKIPIENSYTSGLAGEKTLKAIKEHGEFIGTSCPTCNWTYFPARMFCERCFSRILENDKSVGPEGTLEAVSLVNIDQSGKKTKPYYVGLIKLDKADTKLLHHIKGAKGLVPRPGARVRPVFNSPDKRRGSITDILAFELV